MPEYRETRRTAPQPAVAARRSSQRLVIVETGELPPDDSGDASRYVLVSAKRRPRTETVPPPIVTATLAGLEADDDPYAEFDLRPTEEIKSPWFLPQAPAAEEPRILIPDPPVPASRTKTFDRLHTQREDGGCDCAKYREAHEIGAIRMLPSFVTVPLPFSEYEPFLSVPMRFCFCGKDMDPLLSYDAPEPDPIPYCCRGFQNAVLSGKVSANVRELDGRLYLAGGWLQAGTKFYAFGSCIWCGHDHLASIPAQALLPTARAR